MANRDPSDDAHEARTPVNPQAADAISQPGDQVSSSAKEVVPLFDIINTFLEKLPTLREFMPHHAVFIIEDIDAECFQALAARFPASLNVRFLAQHVLRLCELKAIYDWHDSMPHGYETLVSRVDAEISRRLSDTAVNEDYDCQHIDGCVARHGINDKSVQAAFLGAAGYRWERFINLEDSRRYCKTSTRFSYCRLRENLILVLVDAGSSSIGTIQVIHGVQLLPAHVSDHIVPLDFVENLLGHYTVKSMFTLAGADDFGYMLSTAAYQVLVRNLETEFLGRRHRAAKTDNERAFSMLTDLRRDLINTHQNMATSGRFMVKHVKFLGARADQRQRSPGQDIQASAEDTVPKAYSVTGPQGKKQADLSKLSEIFSDLDARLRTIIAALNEDIQIVIGSVQIQDARAMKRQADLTMQLTQATMRQTEVSVRQTRWTVALAILAASYLPMTLVTGIYGMNIKEISGDKGPNWWWVVVTWAVTMGITVGSVGRYALVEWRWYREGMQGPKVGGNQDSTDGVPGEQDRCTAKPTSGKADDMGNSPITRRKRLWRKIPGNSQHDSARSTV